MRLFATRRECEIILTSLYSKMSTLPIDQLEEYNNLTSRILSVTDKQCKRDNTKYEYFDTDSICEIYHKGVTHANVSNTKPV